MEKLLLLICGAICATITLQTSSAFAFPGDTEVENFQAYEWEEELRPSVIRREFSIPFESSQIVVASNHVEERVYQMEHSLALLSAWAQAEVNVDAFKHKLDSVLTHLFAQRFFGIPFVNINCSFPP
ncbi:MAG: hypothetical protein HON43_01005 [Alphaproteobacteria bacterium]|jgi:hypothetical protein|nr:hypothetical protein [Alphaproteobacteria bacterium]MBT5390209.1 hypothetical protein [Alphaproteobacteria bacterium]MBT5540750.1 hypothetical protein [Alphaproteobacteria bacterium]